MTNAETEAAYQQGLADIGRWYKDEYLKILARPDRHLGMVEDLRKHRLEKIAELKKRLGIEEE